MQIQLGHEPVSVVENRTCFHCGLSKLCKCKEQMEEMIAKVHQTVDDTQSIPLFTVTIDCEFYEPSDILDKMKREREARKL
jgi:hypothetical protein